MEIITRQQALAKGLRRYFTGKACRRGHLAERDLYCHCVKCDQDNNKGWSTSVEGRQYQREWNWKHPNYSREYQREYQKSERGRLVFKIALAQYRASKLNATPSWARNHLDTKAIYALAQKKIEASGLAHEVDHDIPLNGPFVVIGGARTRIVCGLHVPWNLRILTGPENSKKSNRFSPEQAAREQMAWLERNLP